MGLLEVPILLLDKSMGIFLPIIKGRTSINGFVLADKWIKTTVWQHDFIYYIQKSP